MQEELVLFKNDKTQPDVSLKIPEGLTAKQVCEAVEDSLDYLSENGVSDEIVHGLFQKLASRNWKPSDGYFYREDRYIDELLLKIEDKEYTPSKYDIYSLKRIKRARSK